MVPLSPHWGEGDQLTSVWSWMWNATSDVESFIKQHRQSVRAPHPVLAKSTAGFYPERLEEMKQEKNIAGWEQQRTDRQKWELREALLGNGGDEDQEAGGASRKGSEKLNSTRCCSPAVFPRHARCCEVSHSRAGTKRLAAFLAYILQGEGWFNAWL